jgi:hypothetical protein
VLEEFESPHVTVMLDARHEIVVKQRDPVCAHTHEQAHRGGNVNPSRLRKEESAVGRSSLVVIDRCFYKVAVADESVEHLPHVGHRLCGAILVDEALERLLHDT